MNNQETLDSVTMSYKNGILIVNIFILLDFDSKKEMLINYVPEVSVTHKALILCLFFGVKRCDTK